MNNYRVIGSVARVASGRVILTDEQAKHRMLRLKPVHDGIYDVVGEIQFKHGEWFGWSEALPKGMGDALALESTGSTTPKPQNAPDALQEAARHEAEPPKAKVASKKSSK